MSLVCKEAEDSSFLGLYGPAEVVDAGNESRGEAEGGTESADRRRDPGSYDDEIAQTQEQYLQVSTCLLSLLYTVKGVLTM